MIRTLATAACLALAIPASALESMSSPHDVGTTMDRLVAAVEGAGATIFARIDHAAGAAAEGIEMPAAELLIFGNPALGTPVMLEDIRAGQVLPLRVLVHAAPGGSRLVWEEPDAMFDALNVSPDLPQLQMMETALNRLTAAAAARE
jgi:uncharacterized protein (DUF302 family)